MSTILLSNVLTPTPIRTSYSMSSPYVIQLLYYIYLVHPPNTCNLLGDVMLLEERIYTSSEWREGCYLWKRGNLSCQGDKDSSYMILSWASYVYPTRTTKDRVSLLLSQETLLLMLLVLVIHVARRYPTISIKCLTGNRDGMYNGEGTLLMTSRYTDHLPH